MQQANISVRKNRLKIYPGNTVFLKDGQEFEIELFNSSNIASLAKILINGKLISNTGIVIKPGQRIHLDRFIDTPEKFKFETYKVEGNSVEVQKAIQDNGLVEVSFYDEYVIPYYNLYTTTYTSNIGDVKYRKSPSVEHPLSYLRNKTASFSAGDRSSLSDYVKRKGASGQSCGMLDDMHMFEEEEKKRETGRIEKGGQSDQKFSNYQGQFNSYISKVEKIKILPYSEKPIEVQELVNYCTNCGTKNKGSKYKFCPTCGTKF